MQKLSYDDFKLEYRRYNIPIHTAAFAFIGSVWGHDVWEKGSGEIVAHFHNCMEIGYCHEGEGFGFIEEKKVVYQQGDICVIAPNTIHTFAAKEGTASKWEWIMADTKAALKGTKYETLGSDRRLLMDNPATGNLFPEKEYPSLMQKVKMLLHLFHQKEVRANAVKGLLLSFLADYAACQAEISDDVPRQLVQNKMIPVLLYIQEHYMEKITVRTLAEICALSEEQFRRVFKLVTRTAPLEYLNQHRIRAACKLLLSTEMPISEVARLTGFATASTFNRQFAAVIGMSPLKWKQMTAEKAEIAQVESLEAGQRAGIIL
ncbi:MAG: helix-turn-helix domain-containing protein [Lachnospiraceae bacterium]|nr:helix-turn-helix domain-containing protein [Lachnospiraceae bacterium]